MNSHPLPYSFSMPNSMISIGGPAPQSNPDTRDLVRRLVFAIADYERVDVCWSSTARTKGEGPPDFQLIHQRDIYPGEQGLATSASIWASKHSDKWVGMSPKEWDDITEPFRVTVLIPASSVHSKRHVAIEFSPIPESDIDNERAALGQEFWADPEAFAARNCPQCSAERVVTLIEQLASVVPTGYSTLPDTSVPNPDTTKYPAVLEAYFAATEHFGLVGRTHLFPSAGPISRQQALEIRKELTARERDAAGRVARYPSPYKHWVTGLFPITARGNWGIAMDVSTSSTRGSLWAYFGGEDSLLEVSDSLCQFLAEAVEAYSSGTTFEGCVLDRDSLRTASPRWLVQDKYSGELLPEPRDL